MVGRRRTVTVFIMLAILLVLAVAAAFIRAASPPPTVGGVAVTRAVMLSAPPMSPTLSVTVSDPSTGRVVRATVLRRRLQIPVAPTTVVVTNGVRQVVATSPGAGLTTLEADHRSGRVFVTELDSATLHAFDAASGRPLWTIAIDPAVRRTDNRPVVRSPLVDEQTGRLFVADFRTGAISTVLSATGRVVRTVRVPAGGIDMVAIAATKRVFIFHGGQVSVLDATSGRLMGTRTIGRVFDYGPAVVDRRGGRVFLSNGRTNSVTVLDGLTGHVVRSIPVGAHPTLPVVDEGAGSAGQVRVWSIGPISASGGTGAGTTAILDGRSGVLVRTVAGNVGGVGMGQMGQRPPMRVVTQTDRWGWIPAAVRAHLPFVPPPPRPQLVAPPYEIDLSVAS